MIENDKGESIIESLAAFLIAAVAITALLNSVFVSKKLIDIGYKNDETFYFEEQLSDDFLSNVISNYENDEMEIIIDDNIVDVIRVQIYTTEKYGLKTFKYD